eukprot:TRINITY_DN4174_c0_g1_i2.p1 TRINITY_DN4174_c0_g1~~TRINITY_DN4174_c0_g1_i2.p1  ORF type:complete len:233 (+),score=35.68 TRINITY_DN4174_c0_g1_i2:326-1024(+)
MIINGENTKRSTNKKDASNNNNKAAEETEETWLYYCKKNVSADEMSKALNIKRDCVVEFNAERWTSEELMWKDVLSKLDANLSQMTDWEKTSAVTLRSIASAAFTDILQKEYLIVVRQLPNDEKTFQARLPNLVSLCEIISSTWTELEALDNPQLLGKIALVLESDKKIDELCIYKEDSKIVLYVDPLIVQLRLLMAVLTTTKSFCMHCVYFFSITSKSTGLSVYLLSLIHI